VTVSDPHRTYELRCPIHGFIPFNDWERDIINHSAFQRLRRIRQLAWTDQVYPGAMHTRFEHSLGVMHIASQLFEAVCGGSRPLLRNEGYTDDGLRLDKDVVRLAALLHDVGHSPFSHGAESLFPIDPATKKPFKHEAYSAAIIRSEFRDVIDNHPFNQRNHCITADQIACLLEGSSGAGHRIFWRALIDGQMDADRMDYLLRDSMHAGVDYGKYDWRRLLNTIEAIEKPQQPGETGRQGLRLGVAEGGYHAAEALVLARYYMFTQVYFHKTRVAYDLHLRGAMKEILPGGIFPSPSADGIKEYLRWDDWRVLGQLASGKGGEHGARLSSRQHYRQVYYTPETPSSGDLVKLDQARERIGDLVVAEESSTTSAYKLDGPDISVVSDDGARVLRPLSHYSSVVRNLNKIAITRLYARPERADIARSRIADLLKGDT
jgi:uncharacterized protein